MSQRPRVVALGGGHGLAASLRAIRRYAAVPTAIVSVADDGGSSGRLREAFGIPAPGDARKCLVALGDESSLWTQAFEHRFTIPELDGHAFGNLVIAGVAEVCGDFGAAIAEAGKLVGAVGAVYPATTQAVVLKADAMGHSVEGQVAVAGAAGISSVSIVPPDAEPPPAALAALAAADQVVVGPGSLYTSVLAVVAVPRICDALAATPGRKIYVCNLREQVPETQGYDVADHLAALAAHGLEVDVVLCDPGGPALGDLPPNIDVVTEPLARPHGLSHDPALLGAALARLLPS